MGKKTKKDKRRHRPESLALAADRHLCYQQSVQAPEADLEFFCQRFEERRGRRPLSLREDFCGTAYLSSHWLASDHERSALAVDLDEETITWGKLHNFPPAIADRIAFRSADVRAVTSPQVDLACAMNFSFCVFKRRSELKQYFQAVAEGLVDDGVFICELYGGTEAIIEIEESRDVDDFLFIWEQAAFNPLTNETLCHIHFEFEDGSRMEKAFTYDWRLWSIPEVRELLEEAGFQHVDVYWEEVDEEGDGTGEHHLAIEEQNQEGWLVFIVAAK